MTDLRNELRLAKAWRRTEPVEPDVAPPSSGAKAGWHMRASVSIYSAVERGMSEASSHYVGERAWDRALAKSWHDRNRLGCGSQRQISMYSTRLLALRAMRHQIELAVSSELAKIDAQIEREIAEPSPLPPVVA